MSTGTSCHFCHFCHLLHVSKKSFWSIILYNFVIILYMYIAPGQGQTVSRRQSFDVNRNVLSLHFFGASFKKNVFEVWFYTFFNCPKCHIYKEIPFIYELGKAERQRGKEIKELRSRVKKLEDTQKVQVSAIQLPPINIPVHYQSQLLQ